MTASVRTLFFYIMIFFPLAKAKGKESPNNSIFFTGEQERAHIYMTSVYSMLTG